MDISKPLPDGSVIVTIDGAELRAFPAEQMREIAKIKAERDSLLVQKAALQDQIKILEAIKATDEKIVANQTVQIARLDEMLTATNDVLLKTKDAADACRSAMKVGKVASALNHPAVKIVALVLPFVFARR